MAKNNGLFGLFLCIFVGVCINVGFRFNRDSGLIGNTARIHVRAQSLSLEKQNDTLNIESLSESEKRENAEVKVDEIEKFEEWESSPSRWWLLALIPAFWFIAKRRL